MSNQEENKFPIKKDKNISNRKLDHINLAFESIVEKSNIDSRFFYEPMLSGHAGADKKMPISFGNQQMDFPIWVSSMTGGTEKARQINSLLAKMCKEFGLGMGLGSCRQLLESNERLDEFDVRATIGDQPLYANLGIAQLEKLVEEKALNKVDDLISNLQADGLFIHVNPLQEWMQPEGDHIKNPPIETINEVLKHAQYPIIVKEVGQGMGKESLRALLKLPILAIELAGNGGTNFSKLELLRAHPIRKEAFNNVASLGHTNEQMIQWSNELVDELGDERKCNLLIVSGGISDFLDGYYLMSKSVIPAIYAQASGFLKYAIQDYDALKEYVQIQIEGLKMADALLKVKV